MQDLWLKFLCRYYYRYRIYYFIKDFVFDSKGRYITKRFRELGEGKCLYYIAIEKKPSTNKVRINLQTQCEQWSLRYTYKQIEASLWKEIFSLRYPFGLNKKQFWSY